MTRILNIDRTLRLREPEETEWTMALAWYKDPEVMHFSEGDSAIVYDEETINRMYSWLCNQGELYFIEVFGADGWKAIGDATLASDTLPICIGDQAYRSKGYGKRILERLLERAAEKGMKTLRLKGIYKYNERSQRLYKSLGFEKVGETDDEYIYEWRMGNE